MLAQKSLGPQSDAVFSSMKAVHFNFNGSDCTWYGFWFGFGLTASVFLLLSADIAWQLDKMSQAQWPAVSVIAWALVASHVANTVLSFKYFFVGPGVFGAAVVGLMTVGSLRKQSRA